MRRRSSKVWFLRAAAVAIVGWSMLAGCGGDDDSSAGTDAAGDTADAADVDGNDPDDGNDQGDAAVDAGVDLDLPGEVTIEGDGQSATIGGLPDDLPDGVFVPDSLTVLQGQEVDGAGGTSFLVLGSMPGGPDETGPTIEAGMGTPDSTSASGDAVTRRYEDAVAGFTVSYTVQPNADGDTVFTLRVEARA